MASHSDITVWADWATKLLTYRWLIVINTKCSEHVNLGFGYHHAEFQKPHFKTTPKNMPPLWALSTAKAGDKATELRTSNKHKSYQVLASSQIHMCKIIQELVQKTQLSPFCSECL